MRHFNLFVLIFTLVHVQCNAQVLTAATSVPTPFENYVRTNLQLDSLLSIQGGTSQIWDFSNYTENGGDVWRVLPPDSAPFSDTFSMVDYVIDYGDGSYGYRYLDNGVLKTTGYVQEVFTPTRITIYYNPEPWLRFPLSLGFDTSAYATSDILLEGTTLGARLSRTHFQQEAIGSGTIKFPDGSIYNDVLLVRTDRHFRDSLASDGSDLYTSRTVLYYWYSLDYRMPVGYGLSYESDSGLVSNLHYLDTAQSTLGIPSSNVAAMPEWYAFPNPALDVVHFSRPLNGTLRLYDMHGRLLMDEKVTNANEINIAKLVPGYYTLMLEEAGGVSFKLISKVDSN